MLSRAEQQPSRRLAADPRGAPVEIASAGARLPATYYGARDPAPPGPRLAVLIFERESAHDVHGRLARALASAGYAALVVDVLPASGEPEPELGAFLDSARTGLTELRRRAAPERLVLAASVSLAALVARCAAAEQADGVVLVGSRLPPDGQPADLDVFDALEPFTGAALLLGAGDTEAQGPAAAVLAAHAAGWRQAAADRHLELGVIDGPRATLPVGTDHHLGPGAYAGVVVELTLQWLERRFGPGYPRAWQGPPPAHEVAPPARAEGIEVQVPLLATGATLVPVSDGAPDAATGAWRLELPDGRAFALTDALRRLVGLVDGHRPVGAIAAELSAALGRPISAEQVGHLLRERLAPLGVLEPDARGEGGEEESGMTDILIRCYEPGDRLRALLDNLTRVTRSPYNVIVAVGKRSAVRNQNVALDRARTKYAVFLDDDILLTEGWLERLRETMDRTGAGAVSARQLRMDGTPLSSGAACEKDEIAEICFGGACFMFRTDLGLRFDETFVRSQWDDFDFIFQFYELGYKAYIDGRVEFYHHADPKICQDQNYDYFVRKWTQKGLYRGLMFCRYPGGHRGYLPNFGA
jgi:cellulose synthase/poly-beta-1,6-N-acetylglucosamine synthase-like glycosyltransferase